MAVGEPDRPGDHVCHVARRLNLVVADRGGNLLEIGERLTGQDAAPRQEGWMNSHHAPRYLGYELHTRDRLDATVGF